MTRAWITWGEYYPVLCMDSENAEIAGDPIVDVPDEIYANWRKARRALSRAENIAIEWLQVNHPEVF